MTERHGIDVGNSRVKIFRLPEDAPPAAAADLAVRAAALPASIWSEDDPDSLPADSDVEMISVRPDAAARLARLLAARGSRVRRWEAADLPIANPYDDPSRLGPDRPLAALAARRLVGAPALVVDAGTALTVDLVDREGRFAGGAIAPGLGLLARALGQGGAMLHEVETPREDYPGRSTAEALELGLGAAFRGALERLVRAGLEREPEARLVVTGGDAEIARAALSRHDPVEAPLIAIGLWLLSRSPRA